MKTKIKKTLLSLFYSVEHEKEKEIKGDVDNG